MALPSSGSISLNQMHIEVGSSSGTQVSINDSDIRGLINKSSGATMSFSEWYGASAFTADTVIDITPDISGMKYAVPDFRTYSLTLSSANSIAHNNDITYTSGTTHYVHSAGGSTIVTAGSITFNSSSNPTSGGGTSSYFTGKYWRIPNSYNDGTNINNTGNYLLSNPRSHQINDPMVSGNPLRFSGYILDNATAQPFGQVVKRVVINIY